MATTKQKQAARRNLEKARAAQRSKTKSTSGRRSKELTTAEKNDLPDSKFAFEKARKEPLTDAAHVRNAIARFDQVEDVTDAERDRAWKRIKRAAESYDIEVEADDWRHLFVGGKAEKK